MIDLSFLTEEEQQKILAVLKRDAELKESEERRIQKLQQTEKDRSRLRSLTGEWFYQTKHDRHHDKIHGSDIIKASMRQRRPVTLLELSERWAEKGCVREEKNDVFIPAELCGLIEVSSAKPEPQREDECHLSAEPMKSNQSPCKIARTQRETECINGVEEAETTHAEEAVIPSESCSVLQTVSNTDTSISGQCSVKPVAQNDAQQTFRPDSPLEEPSSDVGVKQAVNLVPKGILKNNISSLGSTDSLEVNISTNDGNISAIVSPVSHSPPLSAPIWFDRKQVRFTSIVSSIQREQAEHSVLEDDQDESGITEVCESIAMAFTSEPCSNESITKSPDHSEVTHSGVESCHDPQSHHLTSNRHEISVESQSSQVSCSLASSQVSGKTPQLSTRTQTSEVEEGHSKSKVLELFGKGSRDGKSEKMKESPGHRETNIVESKDHKKRDVEIEYLAMQPEVKPSPNPRRGLFGLFSRAENKETCLQSQVFEKHEISKDENNFSSITKMDNNGLSTAPHESQIAERTSEQPDHPVRQEFFGEVEDKQIDILPSTMANLEPSNDTGSDYQQILCIHEGAESERLQILQNDPNFLDTGFRAASDKPLKSKSSIQKMYEKEYHVDLLPTTGKNTSSSEDKALEDPTNLLKNEDKVLSREIQDHAECETLRKEISDLKKEISTFKTSLIEPDPKVSFNDLRSIWEKEKSGLNVFGATTTNAKDNTISESSPEHSSTGLSESQMSSNCPDLLSSLDRISFTLQEEINLIEQQMLAKPGDVPGRVRLEDDTRGRVPCIIQNTSHFIPQPISDPHKSMHPLLSPTKALGASNQPRQLSDAELPKKQGHARNPSPSVQPKVYSRDSYPNKECKDGSPLRTFVIDINPSDKCPAKVNPDQTLDEKLSCSLKSPDPKEETEEEVKLSKFVLKERRPSGDLLSNPCLTRSYIPLSLHHYLGLPEQPAVDQTKASDAAEQVTKDGENVESSPSPQSQLECEEITFDSSGSSTPEAWSISHTSSLCDSEEDSPIRSALDRARVRPISISKSLEDLTSTTSQERWRTEPRGDVRISMENVSGDAPDTKLAFSNPQQVKMKSMSMPAFMKQEMELNTISDCASVSSFHDQQRTCHTPSNFSTCSEATSVSSAAGSVMSVYSGDVGNVEVKGSVQFAIHYVPKLGEFHIFIVRCKDLAVADPKRNRSDPYVKCYLLPDKAKYGKKKTSVRKKTVDPSYDEVLRFKIPLDVLTSQKLNISVWHNDTFGRNSFLGEIEVDLAEWDFSSSQINEYPLKGRVHVPSSPKHSLCSEEISAEMKVALRFLSQTSHGHRSKGNGEVQIWVKECRNLPILRGVNVDSFVKCAILPDSSRKARQKTRVLKRDSNPVFNHTMVYDGFRPEDLKETCLELTVWDHDRLSNHFIGGVRLGPGTGRSSGADVNWMDSSGVEVALWERMIQYQNEWVEDVLPLRMMVVSRVSRS